MQLQPATDRAREIQRVIGILHRWGIHTVGDFAALSRDDVARRLGPEAVRMWDRANAKTTRLLQLVRPAELFEETVEFEQEIETIEPLLFMLRRFLDQLSLRLGAIYLVAQEMTLRLNFSDKSCYDHRFEIPEPTNSTEVLFRVLHAHLENFTSEHAVVALSLAMRPARPRDQQFDLFETPLRNATQLHETLTRLTALLGAERVGTPVLEETHRPDAFRMEPFTWQLSSTDLPNEPLPAFALRRFRPAGSADMLRDVIDRHGPYVSSGNWWDDAAWQRAEWDAQLANGTLCRCYEDERGWAVDGIYD